VAEDGRVGISSKLVSCPRQPLVRLRDSSRVSCCYESLLALNDYYDFPSRMSFCQVTESFRRVAQRLTSIDDRYNFPGFQKILQKN
jgi:hypothetical protein